MSEKPASTNPNSEGTSAGIKKSIEQLRLAQQQSQTGSQLPPHKPIDEYKFWKTQPVAKFDEESEQGQNASKLAEPVDASPNIEIAAIENANTSKKSIKQGPSEVKTIADVSSTPQPSPAGFSWATIDVTSDKELTELYESLYGNYVEDQDEQFRFKYSIPFLKWALTPPGWNPEFSVAVRATETGKLLAFISGIPATLNIRGEVIKSVEINFLCVHKQLRSKRMAPVSIREVTRRVNSTGIWQALFTAGALIPTPISTALYFHRVSNWPKLYEVGFAQLDPGSTPALEVARAALPNKVEGFSGFRPLRSDDIDQVYRLLNDYLKKFELYQEFTKDESHHWFASPREEDKVVHCYVVENEGKITDFISAFGLESSVFGSKKYDSIRVAYMYYYATSAEPPHFKSRLEQLYRALLINLKVLGYDVLNALSVMDNPLVMESMKFRPGDGLLNYNLFNWKTPPISGGINENRRLEGTSGIGVVML